VKRVDFFRLLILAEDSGSVRELVNSLIYRGFSCTVVSTEDDLSNTRSGDMVLIDTSANHDGDPISEMTLRIRQDLQVPIVLLADKSVLRDIENDPSIADFILKPYDLDELSARVRRLLQKDTPAAEPTDFLKTDGVVIDIPKCEVTVKGKVVDLTFTEYELLKLLVSKKGQVLTRELLLNKIWGYDYFGGDRTVDVHITRLRNKIEDTTHNIIETVRNIGYRIK
jgi:DNA-binding response OmpR family regulator